MKKFGNVVKKGFDVMVKVNCYFSIVAAILTVANSDFGSFVFAYTSIIGLIDSIKNKAKQGIIINSTFLIMNGYFSIMTVFNLFFK